MPPPSSESAFLLLLGYLVRHRARVGVLLPVALGLLGLLLVQMAVGEIQWRNELPWWLVLVHVVLARRCVGVDRRPRDGALAHSGLAEPRVDWPRGQP